MAVRESADPKPDYKSEYAAVCEWARLSTVHFKGVKGTNRKLFISTPKQVRYTVPKGEIPWGYGQDTDNRTHVFPLYGRVHAVSVNCWCLPDESRTDAAADGEFLVDHRPEH